MTIPRDELRVRWEAARAMALAAGRSTLALFGSTGVTIDYKNDRSPVTQADREAERILREAIVDQFPQDSVIGEELGRIEGTSSFRWVLDPIDGTKSFITGVPLFGTMVGIEHDGEPVAGAIYFPGLDEMIWAARDAGCWASRADGVARRATVRHRKELAECTLLVTDTATFAERHALGAYGKLDQAARFTRSWGDCYGYYLVATGRADIMIDPVLQIWDAVAAQPIIEEAGGIFCDWQGRRRADSGHAVAANEWLIPQVLRILEPLGSTAPS